MKKQPSKVAHNSQPSIFFIAQKAHFRQKKEFYRLSVSPFYNLLELIQSYGKIPIIDLGFHCDRIAIDMDRTIKVRGSTINLSFQQQNYINQDLLCCY